MTYSFKDISTVLYHVVSKNPALLQDDRHYCPKTFKD